MTALRTCQVEDSKRALILFGGKTSQITKDVLSDLHKLKSSVSTDHNTYLFHSTYFDLASSFLGLQVRLDDDCPIAG